MLIGVYIEDLPSIKSRLPRAMLAAVASGIRRNKDLTAYNKNGVSPVSHLIIELLHNSMKKCVISVYVYC